MRVARTLGLVVLVAAAALVLYALRDDAGERTLLGLPVGAAARSVAITHAGETVTVTRTEEGWSGPAGVLAPVTSRSVDALVDALLRVEPGRVVASVGARDLRRAEFGLAEPQIVLELAATDLTARLLLGDKSPLGGEQYATVVSNEDETLDVQLVTAGLSSLFEDAWAAWRDDGIDR